MPSFPLITGYQANFYRFIIFGFVFFSCAFMQVTVIAQDSTWEKPYVGNNPDLLYYPDQNAVYFRYGWENTKRQGIVLKGKVPDARYFSFNLYNDYTKSSILSLADYEILPDKEDASSFTIHIMPEGITGKFSNLIILPDSVSIASVFLRYYLPHENIYANRPLPNIYLLENGKLMPAKPSIQQAPMTTADQAELKRVITANPKIISPKERRIIASSSATLQQKEPIISKVMTMPIFSHYTDPSNINAFNFDPGGNYPNKDNHYIVMPVVRKRNDLLVVRFKAPVFAKQLGDTTKEVRYFSISEGNEYTNTSITLNDEQLRVNSDGFVYVVVAKETRKIRTKLMEMGFNFMPWLHKDKLVLILRHMLPSSGFKYSTGNVPQFDKGRPAKGQEAQMVIGDYALTGKFIRKSSWKSINSIGQLGF